MQAQGVTKTWAVSESDFAAVVAAMYESLEVTTLLQLLPKHGTCDVFPYARYNGANIQSFGYLIVLTTIQVPLHLF